MFFDMAPFTRLVSDFTSPQRKEKLTQRAAFIQKSSGVKLSENETCMLAREKDTVHLPKTHE